MPIIETVVKVVAETAKEAAKEAIKESSKITGNLDKPLRFSDISDIKEGIFKNSGETGKLKDLDKPLNDDSLAETESHMADSQADGESAEFEHRETSDVTEEKEISNQEIDTKQGGRFGDIFKEGEGEKVEVHHMPADSVTELSRNDGPAIRMDKEDHRETASCGNSREAREYREAQKELIDNGKFEEALQMDIDDIREKFGDKYDKAIDEMLDYVKELKEAGKI